MKKTFKLLIIFIGGLTAIIVGALTGYFIIAKNKTFYIYDVRFVEPVEGMAGYIYSDVGKKSTKDKSEEDTKESDTVTYVPIKNQVVYMKSKATNLYPIAVYVASSVGVDKVNITSSDKEIAKITYKDGGCFVEFLKEGLVTITSEYHGVKDSFSIQIFDQLPSSFNVYDFDYYGDYAELFPNNLISYADNEEYRYDYFLNNVSNTGSNANIDGDLIRVDKENLSYDVFEYVDIDSETNELLIKCKKPEEIQKDNIDSTIILQSFYYTEDNKIVIENSYEVKVHVVRYIPEFLQLEISSTPDFEEKVVFTDTTKKDISSIITEEMWINPDLITEDVVEELDNCLKAEKAENYLADHGEIATYNAFLTENVERLYLRVRMVYTNGDIVYLKNGQNSTITFNSASFSDYCDLDPTDDYYIMTLNDENFFSGDGDKFKIEVSINGFTTPKFTFEFEYKTQISANIEDFYKFDTETGVYTFTYWDERAKFDNEIYDKDGNVVGFGV